ncbi:MAG: exosortase system-associated protein, TIGR04073 family [Methylobacter sp.]|jgi:putative exosortase-associated protein (TIGR04073 family)
MKTHKHVLIIALLTAFLAAFSPLGSAAGVNNYGSGMGSGEHTHCKKTGSGEQTYGSKIGNKALRGFTNLLLSPMEIPKNVIMTTNESNPFYGIIGGIFKGLMHTAGRMSSGLIDLVFFPLPTKPNTDPIYPWDDYFDRDTSYCDIFDLDFAEETAQPIALMPVAQPVAQPVATVATAPQAPVDLDQNQQDINRKLDSLFKKRMLK